MPPHLLTIPFSHYCEKARWALEHVDIAFVEAKSLPIVHTLANRRAGAGRTVPALVLPDGTVLGDSTDIVAWADAQRPGSLLPERPVDRDAALALEDAFDTRLGPATRRWAYFHLLPQPDVLHALARHTPTWQRIALRLTRPLAVAALRRGLRIDAAGAERSQATLEATLAMASAQLSDGRRYLVGDRFSVADLTLAALAAPVLLPDEHPVPPAPLAAFPPEARAQIAAWRATPAGAHVLRIYALHRRQRRADA
jgi:glutathione S-transferase